MKSLNRLLLLASFALITNAVHSAEPDTNLFPIMAWNWVPNDAAVLLKMHDAGLTIAGFVAPAALDACQTAGLKAIVSDPRTSDYDWTKVDEAEARKRVSSLITEVGNHPALFGYYLRDEPGAEAFPGLAKVASVVRELSPGKWPYINLFPDYANNQQLGTTNYADYLERFITVCRPTIISYDNYSLMDDGSVRESYWSNLQAVRAACQRHGLEFWNIVLSVAHFSYREPAAADFRFQVYTTLAYGGRGISYFTYFAPQVGNYRMAPIDQFGNPTATWSFMQNVNLQIQKLAPTLLQLTSDDVYHFGPVPNGATGPGTNSLITGVAGNTFVVGDFTHRDGSRYVMIVNKDLARSHHCSPQFRKPPRRLQHVSPYTGALQPFEGEQVWLAPGQGALLKMDW
jgi:hypothetical protein